MAIFELQGPDGAVYEVEAPSDKAALAAFQRMPPASAKPGVIEDVAKSLGAGTAKGLASIPGMFGDVQALGDVAGRWLREKIRGPVSEEEAAAIKSMLPGRMPTTSQITKGIENFTGEFYQPQTTAGKYAHTVGEFVPGLAFGGPRQALQTVIAPALASEFAGQVTEGTKAEPYARVAGALLGGVLPNVARRAITPLPASPERSRLVEALTREGVTDLTAGQTTGRSGLRYFENERGGGRMANTLEKQSEQFTEAALRRVGEQAPRATPEVIDQAFTRIGQQFDDLSARNWAMLDRPFLQDLSKVRDEYFQLVAPNARAPIIENTLQDIATVAQRSQGALTGEIYQSMRSRIDKAARAAKADPELSQALRGIKESLDDVMERTIAQVNPADLGAWREVRQQYRNILAVERAATSAGERAAEGLISPSALRNAVVGQGRRAYARGEGDFAELARAGEAIMRPLPQSGTAPRTSAREMFVSPMGAITGGTAGAAIGGPVGSAIGGAIGAAVPAMAGRLALSRPGRAYLGNQLLANRVPIDPRRIALIEAMLGSEEMRRQLPGPQQVPALPAPR